MPKLPKDMQSAMDIPKRMEENMSYRLIPVGIYQIVVDHVDTDDDKGNPLRTAKGDLKWTWVFKVIADDNGGPIGKGKRFTETTTFIPSAKFRLEDIFGAFGLSEDSDLKEFDGEIARVMVDIRPQQGGENDGKDQNYIKTWFPQS